MSKSVRFRDRATLDVQKSVDWLIKDSGNEVANSFITELETQISTITRFPQSGSSSFAVDLGISDLRFQMMLRHRHLVFYAETPSHIEIIRVIDSRRDLSGLI